MPEHLYTLAGEVVFSPSPLASSFFLSAFLTGLAFLDYLQRSVVSEGVQVAWSTGTRSRHYSVVTRDKVLHDSDQAVGHALLSDFLRSFSAFFSALMDAFLALMEAFFSAYMTSH